MTSLQYGVARNLSQNAVVQFTILFTCTWNSGNKG